MAYKLKRTGAQIDALLDIVANGVSTTTSSNIILYNGTEISYRLNPNEIAVVMQPISDLVITGFNVPEYDENKELEEQKEVFFAEYTICFKLEGGTTIALPEGVLWANGVIPEIADNTEYELSVTYRGINPDNGYFKAVLTPFKSV